MTSNDFEVRPLTGRIGAEIVRLDLSRAPDDVTIEEIRGVLLRWKVLFFRDQEPATQLAFARRFGTVTRAHPTVPGLSGEPDIFPVDAHGGNVAVQWHTDVTFVDRLPGFDPARRLGARRRWRHALGEHCRGVRRPSPSPTHACRVSFCDPHEPIRLRWACAQRNKRGASGVRENV